MRSQTKIAAVLAIAALAVGGVWAFQPQSRDILLSDAAAQPARMGERVALAVTVEIENRGRPDRLLSVSSREAARAVLHGGAPGAGLPIPGNDSASLASDGAHVMLLGLEGEAAPGRLVPITLTFENAGPVRTRARIAEPATGDGGMDHAAHAALQRDVPAESAPAMALSVTPDGEGWVVDVAVQNFRFAPENMDGPHRDGEGHGHIYIDGLKLGRLTSPTARIGALPPGDHVIRVSLNTNDHATYAVDGRLIIAEHRISVSAE